MIKNPSSAARLLCTSLAYLAVLSLGVFPFEFARVTIGPFSVPWAALFFVLLGLCLFLSLILRWIPFSRPPLPIIGLLGMALSLILPSAFGRPTSPFVFEMLFYLSIPVLLFLSVRDRTTLWRLVLLLTLVGSGWASLALARYFGGAAIVADTRVAGSVGNQNSMAFFLEAPYFLVSAALLFAHRLPRRIRWIAAAVSGVLLSAIALSFSRSAWLSTALGHVYLLLRSTRHRLGVMALALAVALGLLGVAWGTNPHFLNRLQSKLTITSGTSFSVRYTALAKSWEAIRQDPLIGIGAGNFAETLRVPAGRGILAHPHNAYVQTWLEQGLLGLLSFVFLLGAPIISFWRRARTDALSIELRIGFCLVLSVYAVHFLFTSFHASLFFWVIYGLGVALWALDTPQESCAESVTSAMR